MPLADWKAAMRQQEKSPQYRFRGHLAPDQLPRTPVLNTAEAAIEDGVVTMRLYDPIDSWGGEWGVSAKEFTAVLDKVKDAEEIRLHINSPGGEVFEAVAIMNALRAHPARVVAIVDGIAASSASFIAASADETVVGRNTELMIHDAWGLTMGNAADMRSMADLLDHLSDNIASVYAEKAGGDVAEWRAHMLAETWYSADEAVEARLANRVDRPDAEPVEDAEKIAAAFDLSAFTYPGREAAPAPSTALPEPQDSPEDARRFAAYMARRHAAKAR